MGLDASVPVKVKEIVNPGDGDLDLEFKADAQRLGLSMNDLVGMKIGSYSALHYLRGFYEMVYEDINGVPSDPNRVHLISHSDCDGYYIAEDFELPIWHPTSSDPEKGYKLSIGSTPRLLAELEFLKPFLEWLPPVEPEDEAHPRDPFEQDLLVAKSVFDDMYLLARASEKSGYPIFFH